MHYKGLNFYIEKKKGYYRHKSDKLNVYLHRLLAEEYFGKCPIGYVVNHKDGNKLNNCRENLEYVTPSRNSQHAAETGLVNNKGSKNYKAKLVEDDILKIRSSTLNNVEEASKYGVCRSTISLIRNGRTWKHV